MPILGDQVKQKLTFFGMVGAVTGALKFKERRDDYQVVSGEEEGQSHVALASPPAYTDDNDEDSIGLGTSPSDRLLNTEMPASERASRNKRPRRCCVCCGMNCSLFWKAFGIVLGIFLLWYVGKFFIWAVQPAVTGLEDMPVYSTSLGCNGAPYIYNSSEVTFTVPLSQRHAGQALDIKGSAAGTITIAQGDASATEVKYELTVRANEKSLLDGVFANYPTLGDPNTVEYSLLQLITPHFDSANSTCMRFDLKMYIPPTMKDLHMQSHVTTHIQFDPTSEISLEHFSVTLYGVDPQNMILPHASLRSARMALEVYRGWIVGDVSITNTTTITTQRGDGKVNLHVRPVPPSSGENPSEIPVAYFETVTGSGRTDIFYENDKRFAHRPIDSAHYSQRKGDVYLTYKGAEYNGFVEIDAKSSMTTGVHGGSVRIPAEKTDLPWVGDKNGGDKLMAKSPYGWIGAYF